MRTTGQGDGPFQRCLQRCSGACASLFARGLRLRLQKMTSEPGRGFHCDSGALRSPRRPEWGQVDWEAGTLVPRVPAAPRPPCCILRRGRDGRVWWEAAWLGS